MFSRIQYIRSWKEISWNIQGSKHSVENKVHPRKNKNKWIYKWTKNPCNPKSWYFIFSFLRRRKVSIHISIEQEHHQTYIITWLEYWPNQIQWVFKSTSVLHIPIEHADDVKKLYFRLLWAYWQLCQRRLPSASITQQYTMKRLPCVL